MPRVMLSIATFVRTERIARMMFGGVLGFGVLMRANEMSNIMHHGGHITYAVCISNQRAHCILSLAHAQQQRNVSCPRPLPTLLWSLQWQVNMTYPMTRK